MKELGAGSVDICVTSPPYNIGIDYGKYDDNGSRAEYLDWMETWAQQLHRIIKEDGSFFLNVGGSPSNPWLPYEMVLRMRKFFALQNTFHWVKAITLDTRGGETVSAGHFKPINSKRYVNDCHEYIFHLTKAGDTTIDRLAIGVPYTDKSNLTRWAHTGGRDVRCRGNTWFIPYETIRSRGQQRPHPASFPKELPERCIRLHGCREGLVVVDPFLGIGNSAVAAATCGVTQFIGFEIDKDYLEVAQNTLAAMNAAVNTTT